jgi:hypothetical protein
LNVDIDFQTYNTINAIIIPKKCYRKTIIIYYTIFGVLLDLGKDIILSTW